MAVTPTTRPIYDRAYPPLKRFSWPWRLLATYTSFLAWLASTPWLVVRSVAPANFKDNLDDLERSFFNVATPIVTFVQDTTNKIFATLDSTVCVGVVVGTDWAINTATHVYQHNLKGFEHTFENLLLNLEQRVRILKNEGLNGIPKAVSFDVSVPLVQKTPLANTPIAEKLS
ncbi:hypothetical protein VOLCADRAFT_88631 [Volvox carteri f. nagariensis]|uniref:Uncharacterized protein n=1 Tax=Volvox carteri f. nagariensis TaxID=3068 RepID=D8TPI6_VOLCA|nr:uncharacterized protein VOLCADRAFT_88631 [Volvox carteri f. nagariensis]EFJ50773.1 hypothetical protein VOLCADRAFT_88631 [Volvox carteri f. nagariensis]|eukprot:XP_002948366.1 hypothetical protein VOLCADRAFT_88631 [Volvox carteri f. nagariensis]